ncbi:unnamed protein product, partial [marine sediment metagenome]
MGKLMNKTLDKQPYDILTKLAKQVMKGGKVTKEDIDNYLYDILQSD